MSNGQTGAKHLRDDLKPYIWKPGQSGNPNGRPKVKVISEYVREKLADIDPSTGKPVGEMIAEKLILQAIQGENDARTTVLNRTEGMVMQTYQIGRNEVIITGTLEDLIKLRALALDNRGGEEIVDISLEGKDE